MYMCFIYIKNTCYKNEVKLTIGKMYIELSIIILMFLNIFSRLLYNDWDIRVALKAFTSDLKNNKINEDKLMLDEEMSDISSLLDDEID